MGVRLIKISVVYFVIGVLLGYYMSTAHAYNLTPVHVHINLLGWTSLTLAGILYVLFPNLAATKLAKAHFWLHNIGLPAMMIGLAFMVYGNTSLTFATIISANLVTLAVILFAVNILMNLKEKTE
ncbi:cytochrome-c oxidase [Anaerobacillus alkaliphilus]|uniref:Cytochrome-c oxidase n=1 Tax=Anaerobacillus alkaliphilus TaxID=1548597 RepID=A0A4Q0VUX1_9BACI|nr:cytochrome-c oxidase [Anaerobacillus alkaliphilus]RXJ01727.1 cytochrome-c oxidase [Anaerobacillus alkaliphilus]